MTNHVPVMLWSTIIFTC